MRHLKSTRALSRRSALVALAMVLAPVACSRSPQPAGEAVPAVRPADVDTLVEEYWQRYLELNPLTATAIGDRRYNDRLANSLSERWLADSLALEQDFLARAREIDAATLKPAQRLTLEIFEYGRQSSIDGAQFPAELLPINQMVSVPVFFAQMGSGTNIQPFATVADYEAFLRRIPDFIRYCDQAIDNMRLGLEKGIVQPRIVVEKTIPQLAALIVADPAASVFYRPIANFPADIGAADRVRLEGRFRKAISEELNPTYAKLERFLREEYLPAARDTVGMSALPNGRAWYDYLVRSYTTTDLDADRIHERGLAEVARIHGEMERIRTEVGFDGDLTAFIEHLKTDPQFHFETPAALLDAYAALRDRVTAEVPALFSRLPKAGFEIRPVEAFREQSAAPASYQRGLADGSRPGVFYVNTYDVTSRPSYMLESIFLHEAIPGHHFQIALQQELPSLPSFRRYGGETAYTEGWGLYAESLGRELGEYADPYSSFGALTAEIWRAVRLVVDTGLHAKGWTRAQAIDYMTANTAIGKTDIEAEVDRYIAVPGQALAYKLGELRIRELRERAEAALGDRFDVRAFHAAVLEDGSMPLDVLAAKIDRWIAAQQQS
jgi:uncharacterized protein (DUF885 family)